MITFLYTSMKSAVSVKYDSKHMVSQFGTYIYYYTVVV